MTKTSGSVDLTRRSFLAVLGAGAFHGGAAKADPVSAYSLIRAAGPHRELGRQHGEQAAAKIQSYLQRITASNRLSREEFRQRALLYRPLFEKYCPHLLEEIQGLGEGARISFAEALAINIEANGDDLSRATAEGCTTYVIGRGGTTNRQILAGQNSDMDPGIPPHGYVLHLKPVNKPEVLIWTFGGMIGYHGMNSAGVAHFANALGGGPAPKFGMPYFPVKRMMLECTHVDQVVQIFEKVPQYANGNYVVCDGHGNILDIESTTAGPEILRDNGAGFLAHTNHYLCARYARPENFAQSWKDSFPRLERMNSLLHAKFGSLAVEDLKKFQSDHSGYPQSICRHDGESLTVASLISEPAERCLHVAFGNPCKSRYVKYSM